MLAAMSTAAAILILIGIFVLAGLLLAVPRLFPNREPPRRDGPERPEGPGRDGQP